LEADDAVVPKLKEALERRMYDIHENIIQTLKELPGFACSPGIPGTMMLILLSCMIIEGSLEVKLPTIWTDGTAEVGRVREEKSRREKIREEKESEERRCRCAKR
jgi:hypothetical protein